MPFRKQSTFRRTATNPKLIILTWSPSTNLWLFPINADSRERLVTLFALLNKKTRNGFAPRPRVNYFERKTLYSQAKKQGYRLNFHRVPPVSVFLKFARGSDWEHKLPDTYLDPAAFRPMPEPETDPEVDEPAPPRPKAKDSTANRVLPPMNRRFVGKMSDYFSGE